MAGGGTGGHLFPALALAQEFRRRDGRSEIVFMGGKGGLEEKLVPKYGYPIVLFDVEGIKRRSPLNRIKALFKAFNSTIRAIRILRELKPDAVIGSGSYSSAPVVTAAKILGLKTAILEQNALPGLTNKVLGKVVNRIYIAFEEAQRFFPGGRAILAGNPVREEILSWIGQKKQTRKDRFTVLVFGGSQGATAINAAFLDSLEYLNDILGSMRIIHQTGNDGYEQAAGAYRRKGIKGAEVHRFIEDMAEAYGAADLVICRAGATSLAEITAMGLAAVLVPYPFAADNHQELNAICLEKAGAAVMITQDKLTGRILAETIKKFHNDPGALKEARERSRALGKPDAAQKIVDSITRLVEKGV